MRFLLEWLIAWPYPSTHLCVCARLIYTHLNKYLCVLCQVGFVETKRRQRIAVVMFQRPTATITLLYRCTHKYMYISM